MPEINLNFEEIYKTWDKLPQCRIRIDLHNDGGENMWGRQLAGGLIGIDNNPIQREYRWQDVVLPQGDAPQVVHRRWNAKFWFFYTAGSDEAEDRKLRKQIFERLSPIGNVSFFVPGQGFVLIEKKEKAYTAVTKALEGLSIITAIEDEDTAS